MKKQIFNKKHFQSDIANISNAIRFIYLCDRKLCIGRFSLIVLQSILPFASFYLLKLLVDSVTNSGGINDSFMKIWIYGGFFCALFLLIRISTILIAFMDEILGQKLIDYISGLLHGKSTELDMAFYDNSEYHDTFHRAQQEANHRPIQILNNLTNLIKDFITFIGIIILLSTLSFWIAVVMLVVALPTLVAKIWKSKILFNYINKNTYLLRKTNYFSKLLTHREYAKEVRLFNLAPHFQEQFNVIRKKLVTTRFKIILSQSKFDLLTSFFEVGVLFGIIIFLCQRTFTNTITIGSFVMFFEAFRKGQGLVQNIVTNLSGIYNNKLFLNNLFGFLKLEPRIKSPDKAIPFPIKIKKGILFQNVSFVYPNSGKLILDRLSFEAKPGEIILIRGENGAGKTTIIKLLCRLYECTNGAIFIDGINIRDFNLAELRKNISVIFQDFVKYDLTVQENFNFNNKKDGNGLRKIQNAAKLSTADKIINNLPNGYNTVLGKYFKHGEELSMGQWQRISLGRTFFKDSPILIFDEPTSWMDLNAKTKIYKNIGHLGKDKIILLISHSFKDDFSYTDKGLTVRNIIINNQQNYF